MLHSTQSARVVPVAAQINAVRCISMYVPVNVLLTATVFMPHEFGISFRYSRLRRQEYYGNRFLLSISNVLISQKL